MASNTLAGKKVAFLTAQEGIEEVELTEPWKAVERAGGTPKLIAPENGEIQAFNHLDKSETYKVDESLADAEADDYDGLVLPGGVANPDQLRTDERAIDFVQRKATLLCTASGIARNNAGICSVSWANRTSTCFR